MAIMQALKKYHPTVSQIITILTKYNVWFETFEHQPVRTSEEAAAIRTGYTLEQGAKALILKAKVANSESFFCMVVVAGTKKFNSKKVIKALKAKSIRFATPEEVSRLTNGVEIGGVPPWGNLFDLKTFVDTSITSQEAIIFNAGDRSFSIAMRTNDYLALHPSTEVTVTEDTKQ